MLRMIILEHGFIRLLKARSKHINVFPAVNLQRQAFVLTLFLSDIRIKKN